MRMRKYNHLYYLSVIRAIMALVAFPVANRNISIKMKIFAEFKLWILAPNRFSDMALPRKYYPFNAVAR